MGDRTSWELVRRDAGGRIPTTTSWGAEVCRPRQEGYYITVIPGPQASLPRATTVVAPGHGAFAKVCARARAHEALHPPFRPSAEISRNRPIGRGSGPRP